MTRRAELRGDGRLALPGGLRLTLQRAFEADWTAEGERPPRSYGRLSFVLDPRGEGFVIPILPGEAVWIGLEAPEPPAAANIAMTPVAGGKALTRTCPPDHAIKGVYLGSTWRAIAAGDVLRFSIETDPGGETCALQLAAKPAGEVLGAAALGALAPLDRSSGFSGVRLP